MAYINEDRLAGVQQSVAPPGRENAESQARNAGAKWSVDRSIVLVSVYQEHALIWDSKSPGTTQVKHMTGTEKWESIANSFQKK